MRTLGGGGPNLLCPRPLQSQGGAHEGTSRRHPPKGSRCNTSLLCRRNGIDGFSVAANDDSLKRCVLFHVSALSLLCCPTTPNMCVLRHSFIMLLAARSNDRNERRTETASMARQSDKISSFAITDPHRPTRERNLDNKRGQLQWSYCSCRLFLACVAGRTFIAHRN